MSLKRAFVIYETEAAARARLEAFGYAPDVAAEIAVYLGQRTDLPDVFAEIQAGGRAQGFAVAFVELDDWLGARDAAARRAVAGIEAGVRRLAKTLDLCDYFSCDFRIAADERPVLFEFETAPAVTIYDFQS